VKREAFVAALLLGAALGACSGDGGTSLYETAQLEERQNNPAHARELYEEITRKYPQSDYARKAEDRLRALATRPD
jgi:outer membrane protein assembly factor BamD (BamD/ComL family)